MVIVKRSFTCFELFWFERRNLIFDYLQVILLLRWSSMPLYPTLSRLWCLFRRWLQRHPLLRNTQLPPQQVCSLFCTITFHCQALVFFSLKKQTQSFYITLLCQLRLETCSRNTIWCKFWMGHAAEMVKKWINQWNSNAHIYSRGSPWSKPVDFLRWLRCFHVSDDSNNH